MAHNGLHCAVISSILIELLTKKQIKMSEFKSYSGLSAHKLKQNDKSEIIKQRYPFVQYQDCKRTLELIQRIQFLVSFVNCLKVL